MTATDVTGLTVLARAEWPSSMESPDDTSANLPRIAGFVVSDFNPLVAEVAERCLTAHPVCGATTGVVLASRYGDTATNDELYGALAAGRRVMPLLFFQSNPNAVIGYVTARWGLAGPVVCTSPLGDPLADGVAVAELLIEDDAATEVLVIAADLAWDDRDRAVALLVARPRAGEG